MCSREEVKVKTLENSILLVFALLPCIGDWALYSSLSSIEEGLVYGPIPQVKVNCILAWSIIGTAFAVIKILYHGTKLANSEEWCSLHGSRYRTASIFLDLAYDAIYQLPKIAFKLWIIRCREEGLNVIICVTSAIDLLSSVFPICGYVLAFFKYLGCCNNNAESEGNGEAVTNVNGRVKIGVNVARFIALLANLGITITIIIFSLHFRSKSDGAILSKQKFNIYNKVYDMDRYFKNVGVFFAHPKLDNQWNYNFSHVDWIKLYPFYHEIFDEDIGLSSPECFPSKTLTHRIHFSDVPATSIFYFKITHREKNKVEHYIVDTSSKYVGTTTHYSEIEKYHSYTIIIKSDFISSDKSKSRVFGRIRFNWKTLWPSGNCTSPNITIVDDDYKMTATKPYAIIQYFRERREVPAHHTFLKKEGSQVRFYNPKEDLEDIEKVWRPGFGDCESTGDLAPVFDTSLNVEC